MIYRLRAGLAAGVLFVCSAMAAAQAALPSAIVKSGPDFTVTIPVALHQLDPRVDRFKVACALVDATSKPLQQANATLQSTGVITKLGGLHDFVGNVAYATSLAIPAQRPLAAQYICELRLLTVSDYDGSGVIPVACTPTDMTGPQSYKCVKTGAPLRPQISGSLPTP